MTELVKKITAKGIVPDLAERVKTPGDLYDADEKTIVATPVFHVYGLARKYDAERSQYGEYLRFTGDFEAVNLKTGEVHRAGSMILPDIAENVLAGAMNTEGAQAVQFALEIGVKPSKSPVGYDYTVKPLVENREAEDALTTLRAASRAALPAPSKSDGEQVADNAAGKKK
ncbi:hypothetical protein C4587_01790 [Candidatus Parcubacteria bacterium]|nr:MAG: hypothetical protein C4587_01790 [Candidatus Parcubacteria bacterium]